jgi:hypothetical protein
MFNQSPLHPMSEKKDPREERSHAVSWGTPKFEELIAGHEAWWNDSMGLQSRCEGIEESVAWDLFKNEFDKPENQVLRIVEYDRGHSWELSGDLIYLISLADLAAGNEQIFRSKKLRGIDSASAGKMLGVEVLDLFSVGSLGRLQEIVKALDQQRIRKDKKRTDNRSIVSDMIIAFISYVERVKRLPRTKELNIEANRLQNDLCEGEMGWEDVRWDSNVFSQHRKRAGFAGLQKGPYSQKSGG